MRFEDQVAIVTGAASGLGRAYAIALAERGARVVIIDNEALTTKDSGLRSCAAAITALGGEAQVFCLDVSDSSVVQQMVDEVLSTWGRVDILINNAGIHHSCPFEHLSEATWKRQFDVDVHGSFNMTKAVWPCMKRSGYGRVIMTCASSIFGDMYESSFSASKMALIGLVNSLHLEGEEFGIAVNTITPHAVTQMTADHLAPAVRPLFSKTTVLSAMLYLCSSECPSGKHIFAAAGGISQAEVVEFAASRFTAEECTPEIIHSRWSEIYRSKPYRGRSSGEAQVLAWAKASAEQRNIDIE
ncbi:SDR family NAD(P)-dependent oxidoreductase [Shewanella gelidimarina]|uniref:SDR family NAD(P)-dependent oxidoreductase n=1 Tax=Shewanella gelidimarina TaxID=56813 RepID=UPI00200E8DE9|nr:SDR family NAD(P)-dependent oxidoreductase [Shewanella gelidimarina]MCL1060298.1 SDR family NAD(P)-dependent oxidoreductase [Shewanella gelidimarina]